MISEWTEAKERWLQERGVGRWSETVYVVFRKHPFFWEPYLVCEDPKVADEMAASFGEDEKRSPLGNVVPVKLMKAR